MPLHAPLLGGAAAVVRERGDVFDAADLQAGVLELEDGLFAAGARALDLDLDLHHAALAGFGGGLFGGASGGEGGALAGALEADGAGGGPGDCFTVQVGDRDHRVVER